MKKQAKDLLIIGQGIGGSMLAWSAQKAALSFDIIDNGSLVSASAVSSGIINPITGPKYVKSWLIDKLLPVAQHVYHEIESELEITVIRKEQLIRHIPDIVSENLWDSRKLDPNYENMLSEHESFHEFSKLFRNAHRFGKIEHAFRIDPPNLLSSLRRLWESQGNLESIFFDISELIQKEGQYYYGEKSYRNIIFAMGHLGIQNRFFPIEDYRPVKGEVLIGRIDNMSEDSIVKFSKFIVPLGNQKFWIGSNYQRDFNDLLPDKIQAVQIVRFLEEETNLSFQIMDHKAGVRPSTKFRQPFIGEHPKHKGMFLFNGLGTKGMSLAPYFSQQVIEAISSGIPLVPTAAFQSSTEHLRRF